MRAFIIKIIVILSLLFFLSINTEAATIYVDTAPGADCSGNYSIANRNCSGSDGDSYDTIQEAITNCSVGDTIYMRAGTYTEINIDPPESKNGTAWTAGNFTTLASYPGEWAIVDATGLGAGNDWEDQAVFSHPPGYGTGETTYYNKYWVFERFEVTGGRTGFFLKLDHVKFRYMYIHDNGRDVGDTLVGGILSVCPMYVTIEYCYFKDNIQPTPNMNNANILFDSDYQDTTGNGGAFDPNAATHHNIVRYNYMVGSKISLRQKNQQRFGYNDRDPSTMTYKDYGDKFHHNIIFDATESIGAGQDFIQVYNNIVDSTINIGRRAGSASDIPIIYNGVIYNNTVKRDATSASYGSYTTSGGYSTSYDNYYDVGAQKTIHEHVWFLNNIADNNPNVYHDEPFSFHWNIPANVSNPDQDMSDMAVDRNLIHDNSNSGDYVVGHNYDAGYEGCANQSIASADFDACSNTWRSIATVANYDNNTSGLYLGASGADQYRTDSTFVVEGATTIADGGLSGAHPYLAGGTIPSYVGATNPSDNDWVAGVLSLNTSYFTSQAAGSDPTWLEGGVGATLTGTIVTGGVTEAEIVAGGETLIITLYGGETWVATVGADNAITTALIVGLDSGGAEAAGWDAEVKGDGTNKLTHAEVVRTSDTVATITLTAKAAYAITTNETVTATIPATALTGGVAIVASPTFEITAAAAVTVALSGTYADGATEAEAKAGTEGLVITLTNDTWHADMGTDVQVTKDLIAGIDSAQSEAAGWDAEIKGDGTNHLTYLNITRTNATTVTIDFDAEASYSITDHETITVTVPASALVLSGDAVVATPTFVITAGNPAAALTGTLADGATEAQIVTGGETLIITLTEDTWVAAGATFDATRQAIIDGMDSAQAETTGWDAEIKGKEVVTAVVRTNDTTCTITLTAAAAYDVSANETITVTVPASALVTSGSPLTATPQFNLVFFDTSTEEIVGITMQ